MPRLFKLVWISLGSSMFLANPLFAEGECTPAVSSCGKCKKYCCDNAIVTWYAPAPPYPVYFGPPYPCTSYQQVHYVTPPAESALIVKQRLMFINMDLAPAPVPGMVLPGAGTPQDPTHGNAPNTHGNAPMPAPQQPAQPDPLPVPGANGSKDAAPRNDLPRDDQNDLPKNELPRK